MSRVNFSHRATVIASAMVVGGLGGAWLTSGWVRWLATAVALTFAPVSWRALQTTPWWQRRRARLPLALLLTLVVVVLAPLLRGEPPVSRDHAIHYFQLHRLVDELLPSGRLWGWSPSLNHGYPYGESYPVLGYLWMAAAHLLSLGAVSLRQSYAWGLAALWILSAAVAWWLAAMITRALSVAPGAPARPPRSAEQSAGWAGLAAATLWLLDTGASRQGGWVYLMFHGVWPQMMAATLWAASLGLTWRALEAPRWRRLALAALALGGSLWAHPFGLLTATASAGIWGGLVLAGSHRWVHPWRTWAIIHGAAALLGAGWLTTFFGSVDSMARAPVPWIPLAEVGADLLHGQLMAGRWLWAAPLALGGSVIVLRRGATLGWVVVILAVSQLVLASEEAITVLRLDLVLSGFKNLQFPRYAISFKPLWFVLGGVGFGGLVAGRRAPEEGSAPQAPRSLDGTRRVLVAGMLAPLLASLAPEAGRLLARPVAAIDTLARGGEAESEAQLRRALRRQARALPPDRPLTVALMRAKMRGTTYPIMSVSDAGGRLVLDEHIPTVNFKHRVRRRPSSYEALGVTHVLHEDPIPSDERALADALTEVGRFGPFTLERFEPPHGKPRRVAELGGVGSVEVVTDAPEVLELRVTEVAPGTSLVIGRAPHTRWAITHDGRPLEIDEIRPGGTSAMEVTLPGPGRVELRYRRSALERAAAWTSALMLVLCLGGLCVPGAVGAGAGREPDARARRVAWIVAGGVGLLLVVVIGRRQDDKLRQTWDAYGEDELRHRDGDPPDFVRDLVIDGDVEVEPPSSRLCSGVRGKDVRAGCSEAAHRPRDSFLYREPYIYRCRRLSVPAKGEVVLWFPPLADDAHRVAGSLVRHVRTGVGKGLYYGLGTSTSTGGRAAGGPSPVRINRPISNRRHDFVLTPSPGGGRPVLAIRNAGRRIEEFCVSAAVFRLPAPGSAAHPQGSSTTP